MHEVYAYGVIAASTVVQLGGSYPPEAGYAEVQRVHQAFGGEAAGGAHVLGRLGVSTKLAGSVLGTDSSADRAIELLAAAGVDCSAIARVEGGGVTELVVSSGAERTIFATYGQMLDDRAWTAPNRNDVAASKVVCLDSFFGSDSETVAAWCLADGIPYVTVDAQPDSMVARHASAIVVSGEYAASNFPDDDAMEIVGRYAHASGELAILTQGGGEVMYQRGQDAARRFPAFEVPVVDTMGAGDSFRAGIAYGLVQGWGDDEAVRTAAAIAAMVCMSAPGVLGSPTAGELAAFLADW